MAKIEYRAENSLDKNLLNFLEMYKSMEKEIKTKLGLPGFNSETVSEEKSEDKPKGKKK